MSEPQGTQVIEDVDKDSIESEDRIDESGVEAFKGMGYTKRLSNKTVMIYKALKSKKDKLQPGRLSPEGMAFVVVLSDMADGKLRLTE